MMKKPKPIIGYRITGDTPPKVERIEVLTRRA